MVEKAVRVTNIKEHRGRRTRGLVVGQAGVDIDGITIKEEERINSLAEALSFGKGIRCGNPEELLDQPDSSPADLRIAHAVEHITGAIVVHNLSKRGIGFRDMRGATIQNNELEGRPVMKIFVFTDEFPEGLILQAFQRAEDLVNRILG